MNTTKSNFSLKTTLKTTIPKDYTHDTMILPHFFQKGKKKIQENSPAAFRAAREPLETLVGFPEVPFSKRS
ncbi:MAG: hypothetical protein LBK08_02135 [Treponema sp.]|jgi:hypothetical protein|nr:hypothetical protein [Treponema sp.]